MKVKKITECSNDDCYLAITDGKKTIEGMCISLPLSNNQKPIAGMPINSLYAFFVTDNPVINRITNAKKQKFKLKKTGLFGIGMSYKVCALVIDSNNYLVQTFGFIISLEYLFGAEYENKPFVFNDDDWISFEIDRFDIVI